MTTPASIRTLLATGCDGRGYSVTCVNLVNAACQAGYSADIFALRQRIGPQRAKIHTALPGPLAYLPYGWTVEKAHARIERKFLDQIRPGEIAYLWPNASLEMHKTLCERGIVVIMEGINTRMASARRILDAAYAALDAPPKHSITDARIAEEEEKYKYATAIFTPHRLVEEALKDSPLEHHVIPASYGVDMRRAAGPRDHRPGDQGITFIFCGYACVRKGAHLLLEAFARLGGPHKLRFVGKVEPLISERYATLLASDRVELVGFVSDVYAQFAQADVFVFPSLEEGDPQVTYEAAASGLPMITSAAGASRMGDVPGRMMIIDPNDSDAFTAALDTLARSRELRAELGQSARKAVEEFDWQKVGARRMESLFARPELTGAGLPAVSSGLKSDKAAALPGG